MEMDDDCLIVSEDINPDSKKKLKVPLPLKTKQALLSFAPVPNKQKKETLQKRTANGNSLSSSECRTEKKRKLSGPVDHLPSAKKPASAPQSRFSPAADAEVSSSCDEISIASPPAASSLPAGQDKPRSGGLLQHFVRREPTQQDEISTSVRDDKDPNGCGSTSKSMKDDHIDKEDSQKFGCGQKHETFCFSSKARLAIPVVKDKDLCNTNDSSDCSEKAVEGDTKEISLTSLSVSKDCSVALERLSPEAYASSEESNSDVPRKKRKLNSVKNEKSDETKPRERASLPNKTVKTNERGNLLTAFLKRGSPRIKEPESLTLSPVPKINSADKFDESVDLSLSNINTANSTTSHAVCGNDDSEVLAIDSKVGDGCEDANSSSLGTPSSKEALKPLQKLTPKTLAKQHENKRKKEEERVKKQQEKLDLKKQKEEEKAKKEEERLRLKKEKEDELKRQREEKEQLKEEKNRKKQEEIDAKNKEREEKRLKLEEEKRTKEEERLKKEEEKQRKEEDRRAKEDEKKRLEQEEEDRKKKVAQKFANFFMANKTVTAQAALPAAGLSSGPFRQMQVSRNTVLAPVQRCVLAAAARAALDAALNKSTPQENTDCTTTYLALLRAGSHTPLTTSATPPPVLNTPEDKDDCLIIEEKEDDDDDDDSFPMGESVVFSESRPNPKKYRGKLLKFSENRRPPYWGTWTKKPAAVGPRKPFAKEQIFDYEYDSDDDWEEEEENGESLSDSEGEKDEEEDEQYEVDNDFFVPHGYLSDDEGQEKEDVDESHDGNDEGSDKEKASAANRQNNQEKLKAKQAEFEKELKKQTKQLKPRVLGCLWLYKAEEQSGAAFEHLLRVLGGHSGVVCPAVDADGASVASTADDPAMGGMIPCMPPTPPASPERPSPPDQCDTPMSIDSATPSSVGGKTSYYKTFPEEAVPSLVRLVHGNRHGKPFLVREFAQFWRLRLQGGVALKSESLDDGAEENEPPSATSQTPSIALSKRSIRLKLSEIGVYKRCPDKGPLFNQVMWYVSSSIREQYGTSDACIPNQWTYCLAPKSSRLDNDSGSCSDARTPSASGAKAPGCTDGVKTPSAAAARTPATNLITKFTKILTEEEKAALNKKKEAPPPKPNASACVHDSKESNDDDVVELDASNEGLISEPNVISAKRHTPKSKAVTKVCTAARESQLNGSAKPSDDESFGSVKKGDNQSGKKRGRPATGNGSAKKVVSMSGKKPVATKLATPARGTSIKKTTPKSSRSIMAFLKRPSESKSPSSPRGAKIGSSSLKGVGADSPSGGFDGSGPNKFDSDCIIID